MLRELKELRAASSNGNLRSVRSAALPSPPFPRLSSQAASALAHVSSGHHISAQAATELGQLLGGIESLQAALGVGDAAEAAAAAAAALREAREQRDEAEARLEALRSQLRSELLAAVEEKEMALAELGAARAGAAPRVSQLEAELEVGRRAAHSALPHRATFH